MVLTELHLRNFRNHADTELKPGQGVSALLGKNGQGKTNILEAIAYLGLTKSFTASGDAHVLKIGGEAFEIDAVVVADSGVSHRMHVEYRRDTGQKDILVDGGRPETLASVIGRFPVVILSPEHGAITAGGPAERRRFLDIVLSQMSAAYLSDLLEYRKALRQRNSLLAGSRNGAVPSTAALDPWTEALATVGARIVGRRMQFVEEFRAYVTAAYASVVHSDEIPELQYSGMREPGETVDAIRDRLLLGMRERWAEEIRRGQSLIGPHRDELRLVLNGLGVQEFASQGQHKSYLVALKMAEFSYMRERRQEAPMLLLDDVFSELDESRAENILRLVMAAGQSIITATHERVFHNAIPWNRHHRRFLVENGTCRAS